MVEVVINIQKATKLYGQIIGAKDVSLKVGRGSVFGFLGPNGAGKTTTISMMVDLIRPTSGKIEIFGLDSVRQSLQIRQRIGYLAGDISLDTGLTGWQQLEYYGNIRGNFDKKYVGQLAERLDCKLSKKFKNLSRGNRQKVGLISALMHKPELLILDEPTSGLDPLIQAEFNKIISENQKNGMTAFISSHILSEVQEICDEVAFIRNGKIITVKSLQSLTKEAPKELKLISSDTKLPAALKKLKGIIQLKSHTPNISATYTGDANSLLKLLSRYQIESINIEEPELETLFMKYYEGKNV